MADVSLDYICEKYRGPSAVTESNSTSLCLGASSLRPIHLVHASPITILAYDVRTRAGIPQLRAGHIPHDPHLSRFRGDLSNGRGIYHFYWHRTYNFQRLKPLTIAQHNAQVSIVNDKRHKDFGGDTQPPNFII